VLVRELLSGGFHLGDAVCGRELLCDAVEPGPMSGGLILRGRVDSHNELHVGELLSVWVGDGRSVSGGELLLDAVEPGPMSGGLILRGRVDGRCGVLNW